MTEAQHRKLEFGRDIPYWPQLKHARARGAYTELLNRLELWMLTQPAMAVATFNADRTRADQIGRAHV